MSLRSLGLSSPKLVCRVKRGFGENFLPRRCRASARLVVASSKKPDVVTDRPFTNQGRVIFAVCVFFKQFQKRLDKAMLLAESMDVALVLGSGMHTWPLSVDGLPTKAQRVVLVTLGHTAADDNPSITRFDCTCDAFMECLMRKLHLEADPFVYEEEFVCKWSRTANEVVQIVVDSSAAPDEALCFSHSGTVNGVELERSNLNYSLSATVNVAPGSSLEILLQPRSEFGEAEVVRIVFDDMQGEQGRKTAVFKMKC